jgi:hypothetical protein
VRQLPNEPNKSRVFSAAWKGFLETASKGVQGHRDFPQRHLQTVVNPLDGLSLTSTENVSRRFKTKKQRMTRPILEVADILRVHGDRFLDRYRSSFDFQQIKAFRAIQRCLTAALGGHRDACPSCGYQAISYNTASAVRTFSIVVADSTNALLIAAAGLASGW